MSLKAHQVMRRIGVADGADWVFTGSGRLHHIKAPTKRLVLARGERREASATLCGRFSFDWTDHPICGSSETRACEVCVTAWERRL